MNVQEKSDCAVVPVNQPNNEGLLQRRLGREGRRLRRTSFNLTCARHRAGKRMFQRLRGVWQAARFALPPCIHSKSRMRQRACTDLCGGRRVIGVPTATTGRACFWTGVTFPITRFCVQLGLGPVCKEPVGSPGPVSRSTDDASWHT